MSSMLRTMRREIRHRRGIPRGGWNKPMPPFRNKSAFQRFMRRLFNQNQTPRTRK